MKRYTECVTRPLILQEYSVRIDRRCIVDHDLGLVQSCGADNPVTLERDAQRSRAPASLT
jgi:hypothetical protein